MLKLNVNSKSRIRMGVFGSILVLILLGAAAVLAGSSPSLLITFVIIVGPLAYIALSFSMGSMLTIIDEESGFSQRSLFWQWKRIRWENIKTARLYSPPADAKGITPGLLLEVFDETQKIIISPALSGREGWWEDLLNMVRQRIPEKLSETSTR